MIPASACWRGASASLSLLKFISDKFEAKRAELADTPKRLSASVDV